MYGQCIDIWPMGIILAKMITVVEIQHSGVTAVPHYDILLFQPFNPEAPQLQTLPEDPDDLYAELYYHKEDTQRHLENLESGLITNPDDLLSETLPAHQ